MTKILCNISIYQYKEVEDFVLTKLKCYPYLLDIIGRMLSYI